MEQVLDVYKRPYDPDRPTVCLDESPKQLVSEVRKPIRLPDGSTRHDYEYRREGAAEVYMCFEPLAGKRSITVVEPLAVGGNRGEPGRGRICQCLAHHAGTGQPERPQALRHVRNLRTPKGKGDIGQN